VSRQTALVVTSIASPNDILISLADGAQRSGWPFYIIGDISSPSDFSLPGAQFLNVQEQIETGFATAKASPTRHYARKNIGYLLAMRGGASVIVETDDDNRPLEAFWEPRSFSQRLHVIRSGGWTNVLGYFSDVPIWPRGFPLELIREPLPEFNSLSKAEVCCPIQQSLSDGNPDVDAIYRLLFPHAVSFRKSRRMAISEGVWCPFNSQNTTWAGEAFPLLYLPSFCSFRMTDIWRSFVAQRIAYANGWSILFRDATMYQERNEHDLMRDFEDEIPGYLHNRNICETLTEINLKSGVSAISENLVLCYETLVAHGFFDQRELELLSYWISDLHF
jgi:hypothetical protein